MPQGPYGMDPGDGGYTLEPQGMVVRNFFPGDGWGPQIPFGPGGGFGPGLIPYSTPMYRTDDGVPQRGPASPTSDMMPPMHCPQPCPVTVRADLCAPQGPQAAWDTDPFGDPSGPMPPGVRVVPEYERNGVKNGTGQTTLVGPGGSFVFPTPMLPTEARGPAINSGEIVGSPGSVDAGRPMGAPVGVQTSAFPRIPWWALLAAGFVAWKVLGRR